MFTSGAWGPVCAEGFADGSAAVACKQMGYAGVATPSASVACSLVVELDFCSDVAPRVSGLACTGAESAAKECPYEAGDNVFCAPDEAASLASLLPSALDAMLESLLASPSARAALWQLLVSCLFRGRS